MLVGNWSMTPSPEQRFGRYRLLEPLGAGGMAEVWRARLDDNRGFVRDVVIKRIRKAMVANADFAQLFAREARLSARLHHSNIVQVFEYGEIEGEPYLAMEFVSGTDLHRLMRAVRGPLPFGLVAFIGREVGRALQYAHDARDDGGALVHLVHRDISPSNVMVGFDGSVKLFDFGIARTSNEAPITQTGNFRGKVGYTAPEVVDGQAHDARSDLFGVGVMLYELLTGKRLFSSSSDAATLKLVHAAEVPLLSTVVPEAPVALERIVHRLLARLPGDRYESAAEFVAAIDGVVHELSTGPQQLADFLKRHYQPAPATVSRPVLPPVSSSAETGAVHVLVEEPPLASSRRWVAALGVVALGLGAAFAFRPRAAEAPTPPAVVAPVAQPVVAPPPPQPVMAKVLITSTPASANVSIDGGTRGVTPLALELNDAELPVLLRLEHAGFEPAVVTVTRGQATVDASLKPKVRPPPTKRKTGKGARKAVPDIEGGQVVDPFQ